MDRLLLRFAESPSGKLPYTMTALWRALTEAVCQDAQRMEAHAPSPAEGLAVARAFLEAGMAEFAEQEAAEARARTEARQGREKRACRNGK